MILIADGGSTTTSWALLNSNTTKKFETNGINPSVQNAETIVQTITNEVLPNISNIKQLKDVYFYGAGCTKTSGSLLLNILRQLFSGNIHVDSDLTGSCIATLGLQSGVVAILGTGANSGYFSNGCLVSHTPALGYILGDEGSGAYLGKNLLTHYFKSQLPEHLHHAFSKKYNLTEQDVIKQVYKNTQANVYLASFCSFLSDHKTDPYCRIFIKDAFYQFLQKNIFNYKNYDSNPLCFTGSIAHHFNEYLRDVCSENGINNIIIVQYPIDGLINFYKTKNDINH